MSKLLSCGSSIATFILFIFYFIGKGMRISRMKSTLCETYELEEDVEESIEYEPYFADIGKGVGAFFSVSSPNGFIKVNFYEAVLNTDGEASRGELIKSFSDIYPNEKVYARVNIPDASEACFVEIEKNDYVKISFGIADNMQDGKLVKTGYEMKMPFLAWVYYICS